MCKPTLKKEPWSWSNSPQLNNEPHDSVSESRTWISTLEIQPRHFTFSRQGGSKHFLKGPDTEYFRLWEPQVSVTTTQTQRQPQIMWKQASMAASQWNLIYRRWNLNFICPQVTKISFWFLSTMQKCKTIVDLWVVPRQQAGFANSCSRLASSSFSSTTPQNLPRSHGYVVWSPTVT